MSTNQYYGTYMTKSNHGTAKKWGRIMDINPKTEVVTIYQSSNPEGYRFFRHHLDDIKDFIKDGSIWCNRNFR